MEEVAQFAHQVFAAVDTRDFQNLKPFLTEDCVFTFANMPPARGRDVFELAANQFAGMLASLRHEVCLTLRDGEHMACKVVVHYERTDGFRLSCPAATIWRLRDGKICAYDVFVDNSRLFA